MADTHRPHPDRHPEHNGQTDAVLPEHLGKGRSPTPYTYLPDWVALSGIKPASQALYWQLALHLNNARGDRTVFPTRRSLASRLGFAQARAVDTYLGELIRVGAIDKHTERSPSGRQNTYVLHQEPPLGYTGPLSLADLIIRTRHRSGPEPTDAPTLPSADSSVGNPVDAPVEECGRSAEFGTGCPRSRADGAPQRIGVVRCTAQGWCATAHINQINQPNKPTTTTPEARTAADRLRSGTAPDGGGGGGSHGREREQERPAAALLNRLPTAVRPSRAALPGLEALIEKALTAGWSADGLYRELTQNLAGARNPTGVMISRLRNLPATPPPPPTPDRSASEPDCPMHPGSGRRTDGECAGCWADRQG